ncbi:MAG: YceI family protein [Crocinitomicaceae bacterium]|nr:YceI family protein [Crocinitomicaceae bacterium]
MLKKIIIAGLIIAVLTVGILFLIPWGEYESELDKSELNETIEYNSDSTINETPSLDALEGFYSVSAGETAEILFHTDGLKTTKGGFTAFDIQFAIDNDFTNSTLEVIIKTASINTGNEMRDEHLVDEFFFAEKYPTIEYVASHISLGDTSYVADGELTLNGTTKSLQVPFLHLGSGGSDIPFEAFQGAFEFDRTEYGQAEESGVGNIVRIEFYCELVKE